MHHRFSHAITTILAAASLLITCVDLPVDPTTDTSNASIKLILREGVNPVFDNGSLQEIGLAIKLTNLLDTVYLSSGCNVFDTTFTVDTAKMYDTAWFGARFDDEGECLFTARATMRDRSLKDKTHTLSVHVLAETPGIDFISAPSACTMTAGTTDTLIFVTAVKGGAGIPVYTCTVSPEEGGSFFTSEYSEMRDTVRVIATPETAGEYEIILAAASTGIDEQLRDTASVAVTVKAGIRPSFVHVPETLTAGKADTLLFAVDNSTRPDPLTITLPAEPPLDSSIFTLLPTGADSIVIAISETAQTGTTTISIITSNGVESDTTRYPITITPDTSKTVPEETPVSITQQPSLSDSVFTGDTITLTVVAEGTPIPTYQWYRNEIPLTDDTTASLIINSITPSNRGTYTVVISNGVGEAKTSDKVDIDVLTKAAITKNPESTPAKEGSQATFSVTAAGDEPLSYQWQVNRQNIENETGTSLTISDATPSDDGSKYRCIVTNAFSSDTSLEAVLSVTDKPVHTVTFDTDGGSSVESRQVKEGEKTGRPETDPTKSEHEFAGWYPSKTSGTEFDFNSAITGSITIYAKWTPVYRVTYDANGGTGTVTDGTVYKSGDPVTVKSGSALSRSGYTFEKWTTEKDGSGNSYNSGSPLQIGSASVTLFAKWKKNQCTVTFYGDGATTLPSPTSKTIDEGTALGSFPTEPKKTAYVFFGWWTGAGGTGDSVTAGKVFSSSRTLYAKWVIMDVDRNIYSDVRIGDQVWMVENLKTTRLKDNTPIPRVKYEAQWEALTTPGYCYLNNDVSYGDTYGLLYNWYAVNTQKLAPEGWHVPSLNEWRTLINEVGESNSGKLKETGTDHWKAPNSNATNSTGFTALAGGLRIDDGFGSLDSVADWWTSTYYQEGYAQDVWLIFSNDEFYSDHDDMMDGFNVRCIRDY